MALPMQTGGAIPFQGLMRKIGLLPPKSRKLPLLGSSVHPLRLPLTSHPETGHRAHFFFRGWTPIHRILLSAHASVLEPGRSPHPPHTHVEEEMLLLLGGQVELEYHATGTTTRVLLQPREGIYYPAFLPHTLHNTGKVPAHYFMFKWASVRTPGPGRLSLRTFNGNPPPPTTEPRPFQSTLLIEGETGHLGKFHCHHTTLAPQAGYPPHADRHDVALLVLRGNIQTHGHDLHPHDLAFFPAGSLHGMHNPGPGPAEYLAFEFHARSAWPRPLRRLLRKRRGKSAR